MSKAQEFHLMPHAWSEDGKSILADKYIDAFSKAVEIYVVSAFLTEWPKSLVLNPACIVFKLIVGVDFGTTRKAALESALAWLPPRFRGSFLVFTQRDVCFHPKAMLWRESDGKCYFLVGSSNLTKAAFETNVEANITLDLDEAGFAEARFWMEQIVDRSVDVDEAWLETYKEAPLRKPAGQRVRKNPISDEPIFDLALDLEDATQIWQVEKKLENRRFQRQIFDEHSKKALEGVFRRAAGKAAWTEKDNRSLYEALQTYWSSPNSGTRMGGHQWTILGKHSVLQELAISLVAVLDAPALTRDAVVLAQKDRLQACAAPTRSAVFTELLCHFFPERYPILDKPVIKWSKAVGFGRKNSGTEGDHYMRLTRAMRAALQQAGPKTLGLRTLAELDVLIWFKFHECAINQLEEP